MSWSGAKVAAAVMMAALLCLPGVARADEAEELLAEGLVRLRVGKFKKSLKVLKRARRKAKDPEIKAKVHLNLGVVYAVLRKKRKARKSFTKALKLNPTLTLKKGEVKDKAITLFEEVRAGIKGKLVVKAEPAGSTVLVDGKELGKTPLTQDMAVGSYNLEVRSADGMSSLTRVVVISVDKESEVKGKLEFVGCKLTVASQPEGAKVLVDGKEIGVTPLKDANIPAGEHEIRVEKEGFEPHVAKITAKKGGSAPLALTLKSLTAAPDPATTPDPPKADPTPTPAPTPETGKRFPLWTVVLGGAALGALGAGIGMGLVSDSAFEDYQTTTSQDEYNDLRDKVSAMETGANVSFIAAGVLAVGAAAVYLFWERHARAEGPAEPSGATPAAAAPAASWRVLPTGNGLLVQF